MGNIGDSDAHPAGQIEKVDPSVNKTCGRDHAMLWLLEPRVVLFDPRQSTVSSYEQAHEPLSISGFPRHD